MNSHFSFISKAVWFAVILMAVSLPTISPAATAPSAPSALACGCDYSHIPGAVWWGSQREMAAEDLAAYIAPIFWFSPDEPSLVGRHGSDILAPEPFPFEAGPGPVVYFQIKEVIQDARMEDPAYEPVGIDRARDVIDLESTALMGLEYYAYFADEAGLGAHLHDVEPVEFKLVVAMSDGILLETEKTSCEQRHYVIVATRISAKAHGIEWFWNVLEVNEGTKFPFTLLVEEGKHALATDKNGDGYFTPSYDANVRINDAWGVRDIISSGGLFSGGYQAWMAKVRHPRDRVLPPLPSDSPLNAFADDSILESRYGNAVYELRPLPSMSDAAAWDVKQGPESHLAKFLDGKELPDGPKIGSVSTVDKVFNWIDDGALKRSFSASFYTDGRAGISWVFPFFVLRNLEVPMSGGYVMNRMYAKGPDLKDFGWMAMYSPSASRWVDTYLSAGAEWWNPGSGRRTDFVLETGIKMRAQIGSSPLKFLTFLTDFWGVRMGIKNYGFTDIDHLTYVLEFGAGSF